MRTWLLLSALLLTACQSRDGYFGRVKKPTARRLVFENLGEPASIDLQFMNSLAESNIADALFDSLVRLDPIALEPTAALATHYERNPEATRYIFYLRGHPNPQSIKLPNTTDLRERSERVKSKTTWRAATRRRPTPFRPAGATGGPSRRTISSTHGGGCSIPERPLPTPTLLPI